MNGPLFTIGHLYTTPGALALCVTGLVNPVTLLDRHQSGDWGDLSPDDKTLNDQAVLDADGRILSSYRVGDEKVWIITEADRSATTLLLPEEY